MGLQKQSYRKRRLSLLIATCILYANPAQAAEDYFDMPLEQLLNARVYSASKRSESVSETPAAVYVITNEDIQRSGATHVPDLLRMVPGVNVAQSDSNTWAISIRGFNSALANKLLVLIDGRAIYNPVFGGVFWEAHDLVLEDIERIEVIRGPGGTLWGANAVNGVINIITKHARDTQGNLVSALYGNEEHGTVNMRHGSTSGDNTFYRVHAKGFNRASSRTPGDDDAYDQWGGYRTGFRIDQGDELMLQGNAYYAEAEQRRIESFLTAPFSVLRNQHIEYEGLNLHGRWSDRRDDGSLLSVQSYIDWSRRDEPFNFIDKRTIFDIEAQYNLPPTERNEIITGVGFRFAADNEKGTHNNSFSPQDRHDSLYSAFIQDKITLAPDKWYLTLGSKFEHNEYSGFEVQPSARLQFHPDPNQTLWAAVSRAVRTPTPIEEDLTSTLATAAAIRLAFVPNSDFKPEELTAYEIGYRNQITPKFSIDTAVFYNVYDRLQTSSVLDPIVVINGIDPPHFLVPVQFRNDMEGTTHGFEAAADWTLRDDLRLVLNYSFLHVALEATDPAEETGEDLYPEHQAGARISWNINEKVTLDTNLSYVDRLKASQVKEYIRLDVNLGWQIADNIRFNLVGQNLTNDSHREFGDITDINAAEVERSIFGKLTWEF